LEELSVVTILAGRNAADIFRAVAWRYRRSLSIRWICKINNNTVTVDEGQSRLDLEGWRSGGRNGRPDRWRGRRPSCSPASQIIVAAAVVICSLPLRGGMIG